MLIKIVARNWKIELEKKATGINSRNIIKAGKETEERMNKYNSDFALKWYYSIHIIKHICESFLKIKYISIC